jgi:hypothetical protein
MAYRLAARGLDFFSHLVDAKVFLSSLAVAIIGGAWDLLVYPEFAYSAFASACAFFALRGVSYPLDFLGGGWIRIGPVGGSTNIRNSDRQCAVFLGILLFFGLGNIRSRNAMATVTHWAWYVPAGSKSFT